MRESITKNVKDLEYNRTLARENMGIVLLGTLVISLFFTQGELPLHLSKGIWLIFLIIVMGLMVIYFDRKLSRITNEIKSL